MARAVRAMTTAMSGLVVAQNTTKTMSETAVIDVGPARLIRDAWTGLSVRTWRELGGNGMASPIGASRRGESTAARMPSLPDTDDSTRPGTHIP